MQQMKLRLIGAVVFLFSLSVSILLAYWGVWHGFVLSAVDFINQCKAPTTDSGAVALDLFCFFIGASLALSVAFYLSAFGCGFGATLLFSKKKNLEQHCSFPKRKIWSNTALFQKRKN